MQRGTIKYSKCRSGNKLEEIKEYKNDNIIAIVQPLINNPPFVFFKFENPANDILASNIIGREYNNAIGVIFI